MKKIVDESLENELLQLKHKNLGCWCVDGICTDADELLPVCHGQELMKLLQSNDE